MSKTEQQRQRKLQKKHAKDRAKHKMIARKQNELSSLAGKMTAASGGELLFCGVSEDLNEQGLGYVTIARMGRDGLVAMVHFLIDMGCLGVKNIAAGFQSPANAREQIEECEQRGVNRVQPEIARGLVESAVNYARSLGFEPYADYRKVVPIWGDVVAASAEGLYEFGRNGVPYYISGPDDDSAKQQYVWSKLRERGGPGSVEITHDMSDMGNVYSRDLMDLMDDDCDDDEDSYLEEELEGELPNGVQRRFD